MEASERLEAVRLVAKLAQDDNGDFANRHLNTWESFLSRFKDINEDVRIECLKAATHLMLKRSEIRKDLTRMFKIKHF